MGEVRNVKFGSWMEYATTRWPMTNYHQRETGPRDRFLNCGTSIPIPGDKNLKFGVWLDCVRYKLARANCPQKGHGLARSVGRFWNFRTPPHLWN